jgi:tetratricopeptide (TPR) repeat protein
MAEDKDTSPELAALSQEFAQAAEPAAKFRLGIALIDHLLRLGQYQQALESMAEVQALAQDGEQVARCMQKLGRIYLRLSQYDKAFYHLGEALVQLGSHPDSLELFMVYHDLAWMFYRQGYITKSRSYAEGAQLVISLRPSEDAEVEQARAEFLHLSALIEAASGNHDLALDLLNDEKEVHQRQGNQNRLSAVYNKISSVYQAKGDLMKALRYQEQTMEIAQATGNVFRISVSNKNLAEIYFSLGDLERSEACCRRSMELSQQIGNQIGNVFGCAGLGRVFHSRGDFQQAEASYLEALRVARNIKARDRESSILADLAELYCDWGRLDQASQHLDAAEEINNERDQFLSVRHQIITGRLLFLRDEPQFLGQARAILEAIVSQPLMIDDEESLSAPELEIEANHLLSRVYAKLGMKSKAQSYAAKAQVLTASFSYHFGPEAKERYYAKPEVEKLFEWQKELG